MIIRLKFTIILLATVCLSTLTFANEVPEFPGIGNADDIRVSILKVKTSPAHYAPDLPSIWHGQIQSPVSGMIYVYVRVDYGSNVTITNNPTAAIRNMRTLTTSYLIYDNTFTPITISGNSPVWSDASNSYIAVPFTSKLYLFTFNTTNPTKITNDFCELAAFANYTINGSMTVRSKYSEVATVKVQNFDTQTEKDAAQLEEERQATKLNSLKINIVYPTTATNAIALPYQLNTSMVVNAFSQVGLSSSNFDFISRTMTMPTGLTEIDNDTYFSGEEILCEDADEKLLDFSIDHIDSTIIDNRIAGGKQDSQFFILMRSTNTTAGYDEFLEDNTAGIELPLQGFFKLANDREMMILINNVGLRSFIVIDKERGHFSGINASESNYANNIMIHEICHAIGVEHCPSLKFGSDSIDPCVMGDGDVDISWQAYNKTVWCNYKETHKYYMYKTLGVL